jgi:putative endonuclease
VSVQEEGKSRAESPEARRDWCVYLLTCADGTLYCGVTSDLERRLAMHNGLLAGGAKYTRGRRPVSLAACTEGLTRGEALRLEAKVKKKPRSEKLAALSEGQGRVSES